MIIRKLDDHTSVCGQIAIEDVADLAANGFTVLVNNRPDGEDAHQPLAAQIETAAQAAGIIYRFVPVQRGIGPAEVGGMSDAIDAAEDGRLLAFCRSGTRSALTWALARRSKGADAEGLIRKLSEAGFDPTPIAHLL